MEEVEVLVVGAGVVGLAIARELALSGREVAVVEAASAHGTGISSRNSEVIHAGIYYPPASLKARLCVRGRGLLYDYVARRNVPHWQCGKLIVATRDEDVLQLEAIETNARASGVLSLERLTAEEAKALEPEIACVAALCSAETGIVDSHALMTALLADAREAGCMVAFASPLEHAVRESDGWSVSLPSGAIRARVVVNAAGLEAPAVAAKMKGFPEAHVPRQWLAKGRYFALAGRSPFKRLVYPMPVPGGLGVHLTLDMAGQARFGPDVEWLAEGATPDFDVDPSLAPAFEAEVRRYWPGVREGSLVPAYAGVRPKLAGPGEPAADFRIDGAEVHGVAGTVHLFGIESPGLTAALAIAETVAARVKTR